jgi:hypothetical protein
MAARDRLPRAALALLALLLIAWFGVLFYDHRIGTAAAKRLFETPETAAEWKRSLEQLERAEFLSPGNEWRTIRAGYLLSRDRQAARRLAERVVSAEPDNYNAWLVVMVASRGRDRERWAQAMAEMRRLNPPPGR